MEGRKDTPEPKPKPHILPDGTIAFVGRNITPDGTRHLRLTRLILLRPEGGDSNSLTLENSTAPTNTQQLLGGNMQATATRVESQAVPALSPPMDNGIPAPVNGTSSVEVGLGCPLSSCTSATFTEDFLQTHNYARKRRRASNTRHSPQSKDTGGNLVGGSKFSPIKNCHQDLYRNNLAPFPPRTQPPDHSAVNQQLRSTNLSPRQPESLAQLCGDNDKRLLVRNEHYFYSGPPYVRTVTYEVGNIPPRCEYQSTDGNFPGRRSNCNCEWLYHYHSDGLNLYRRPASTCCCCRYEDAAAGGVELNMDRHHRPPPDYNTVYHVNQHPGESLATYINQGIAATSTTGDSAAVIQPAWMFEFYALLGDSAQGQEIAHETDAEDYPTLVEWDPIPYDYPALVEWDPVPYELEDINLCLTTCIHLSDEEFEVYRNNNDF